MSQGGKWHGKGRLTMKSSTYEGEWVEGKKHGSGVLYYASGDIYQGAFYLGQRHGSGTLFHFRADLTTRVDLMRHGKAEDARIALFWKTLKEMRNGLAKLDRWTTMICK
eukprot:767304-Hanusia_phi.AAC.2